MALSSDHQVEKTVWDWELMNDIKPIWQRPAKEVEDDEYNAFYKTFSKVRQTPAKKKKIAVRRHPVEPHATAENPSCRVRHGSL